MKNKPGGALLAWYDRHRRKLPWREDPSPYRTWISEIMLQQTQVETATPYYLRFIRRFPDVKSLARAREEEVLKYWAGLGYYSRARNLLEAAKTVVREGGRLPEEPEALRRLPGIGRYTAAAIASIAFGKPCALVDGNVARVLSRLFALRGDVKSPELQRRIWQNAEDCLDASRPGDWNQALMELGAKICLPPPSVPRCAQCPLKSLCLARAKGIVLVLPETGPKSKPVSLSWTALYIERGGRVLLWRRGKEERFLKGHWALPEARHLKDAALGPPLKTVRHSITHHRITLSVRKARWEGPLPRPARWVPVSRLRERLVSSLWRKAAAIAGPDLRVP